MAKSKVSFPQEMIILLAPFRDLIAFDKSDIQVVISFLFLQGNGGASS